MKTRIVHTKIWDDDWFQSLSSDAQRLFLFLMTCQEINICGIFELTDRKIGFYTNIKDLISLKEELKDKVIFYNGWVCIRNVDRYNSFNGIKNDIARQRELKQVPKEVIDYIGSIDTSIYTSIHTTLNHNHNTNHKQGMNKRVEEMRKQFGMK